MKLTFRVVADGLQPSNINGPHYIHIEADHLLLAALTSGFQCFHDWRRASSIVHQSRIAQALAGWAYLADSKRHLQLHPAYDSIDATEKGCLSFWYGNVFAQIASKFFLNIDWLAHVAPLVASGFAVQTPGSRRRCDFIGRDGAGHWHVIEVKGRSGTIPSTVRRHARAQASSVLKVCGRPPKSACTCLTSATSTGVNVEMYAIPPAKPLSSKMLPFPTPRLSNFFNAYYFGIREFLKSPTARTVEIDGHSFRVADLPLAGSWAPSPMMATGNQFMVGLITSIYENPSVAGEDLESLPTEWLPRLTVRDGEQRDSLVEAGSKRLLVSRDGIALIRAR